MNIKFLADSQEALDTLIERPYPAIEALPKWYKKLPLRIDPKQLSPQTYSSNPLGRSIKMCMPVFDIMSAGYHIPLHTDVYFQDHPDGSGDIDIQWSESFDNIVSYHPREQYSGYPVPEGYRDLAFKWSIPWVVQTPPGWSCLFVPPSHYDDQPFKCMPAFVDTDKHPVPVLFPFFLKKDFRGLIPKGTPVIQVIPIKREKVKSSFGIVPKSFKTRQKIAFTDIFNMYKKHFRSKKYYEQGGEIKTESKCPFSFLHK